MNNHNYLLPVDDVKFSIPLYTDIPSAEPAIVESIFRCLRIVVISLCYHWSSNQELAWLPGFDVIKGAIHHAEIER